MKFFEKLHFCIRIISTEYPEQLMKIMIKYSDWQITNNKIPVKDEDIIKLMKDIKSYNQVILKASAKTGYGVEHVMRQAVNATFGIECVDMEGKKKKKNCIIM